MDAYSQWEHHERKQQEAEDRRPICDRCSQPIWDEDCYEIEGGLACPNCLENYFKRSTEDYME